MRVRGTETTLGEHGHQIVMLSGTLLGGDDISARFRIDDGIAPRERRRFVRLAVS